MFGQRYSIRKNLPPAEFARGIWNPQMRLWRDVVEDYLYISRKRINNKLSMFKLQMDLLEDIVVNIKIIDSYKKLEGKLIEDKKNGKITKEEYENEKKHFSSEIFSKTILNKALREIADGIVWRYFDYNRAILYMLADKPPIETIRPDQGTINNLYEFSDVFLNHDAVAIYNDITNFLRVGDVTQLKDDGSIEIIEVKTSKKRGRRITRQKQRMSELVEFFNTGLTNYDGKALKIINSNIKQKTYLGLMRNAIQKAKHRGYESLLLGKYIILEIVDFSKVKDNDNDEFLTFFSSKHKSIQEEWSERNDFVFSSFFIDKMDYPKNCAPFSIYPFNIETCTNIIMGKLMIRILFNFSEVLRIIKKSGWDIIDSIIFKSEDEIKSLQGKDVKDLSFLKISKEPLTIEVPPSLFARMQYELLSPFTLLEEFEEIYIRGPQKDFDYCLTNYINEQRNWH